MEFPKHKKIIFLLLVGVHLALLAEFGFCKTSSLSSEEKYLSESYFQQHDSLLDTSFNSYIANELPISLCQTIQADHIKPSVHKRRLIGEGSHRKLHSIIKINIQPDLKAEKNSYLWRFVVVERLPLGVFADPFELQHLITRGVFSDAIVLGDTNLELPTVASNRSVVEVHVDISRDILSTNDNEVKIEVQLPLHIRYPPLEEGRFTRVEFGNPDLFILGNTEKISTNWSCLLTREQDAKSQTVVWEVPCGTKEHSEIVSVVTFVSAVVSALFIVFATVSYPLFVNHR